MSDIELMVRAIMLGTVVVAVVGSVLAVLFRLWLVRQSRETQAHVEARMNRLSEQSLKVLDGAANAYAVVLVASLALAFVGGIIVVGLALAR